MAISPLLSLTPEEAELFYLHYCWPVAGRLVSTRIPFGRYTNAMWLNMRQRLTGAAQAGGLGWDALENLTSARVLTDTDAHGYRVISLQNGETPADVASFMFELSSEVPHVTVLRHGRNLGEFDLQDDWGAYPLPREVVHSAILTGSHPDVLTHDGFFKAGMAYECKGLRQTLTVQATERPGAERFVLPDGRSFVFHGRFLSEAFKPIGEDLSERLELGDRSPFRDLVPA